VRDRRDAGERGRYPGEPGGVRVRGHKDAGRLRGGAVPAGPGGGGDRPGGPCHAGSDQGSGELRQAYLERWPASETTFGQDKPPAPAPGTARPGRCCARAAHARRSTCSGPGCAAPSWYWPAPQRPWQRRRPRASCGAARTAGRSPAMSSRSPQVGTGRSGPWPRPGPPRPRPCRSWPRWLTRAPGPCCTRSTSPAGNGTRCERKKHQPRFAHTARTKETVTGVPQITRFAPDSAWPLTRPYTRREGETPPHSRGRGRGTARPPAASRGLSSRVSPRPGRIRQQARYGIQIPQHPERTSKPKVPGVAGGGCGGLKRSDFVI
jgi:hypothetical protein